MIYWLVSAAALVGVVLNIKKRVACFYIWTCTNAIWTYADFTHGLPAQGALQAVYCVLSVWGIYAWTKDEKAR